MRARALQGASSVLGSSGLGSGLRIVQPIVVLVPIEVRVVAVVEAERALSCNGICVAVGQHVRAARAVSVVAAAAVDNPFIVNGDVAAAHLTGASVTSAARVLGLALPTSACTMVSAASST